MDLTNSDITELAALRRILHRFPDLSGDEARTAERVRETLESVRPDDLITGLGGHGIAAVFQGGEPGPTVLFRCELDGLPIHERAGPEHASTDPGKAHLCGHDGHMTILLGLARLLSRRRPARGRVVLLFQPAEETGAGAEAVLRDVRFGILSPDYSFALHNRPGLPLGYVGLAEGPVNCASRGMKITLAGSEAHAASPETGTSPMPVVAALMPALTALSHGVLHDPEYRLVTVTHARLGEPAFGIAPGRADVFATLRTQTDRGMSALCQEAETLLAETAARHGIAPTFDYVEVFRHCENHPEAVRILNDAVDALNMSHGTEGCPMSASEDFGRFADVSCSAMLFLGSGRDHPALHAPDYDFPDDLIAPAVRLFHRVVRDMLG